MTQSIQFPKAVHYAVPLVGKPLADLLARCNSGDAAAWDSVIQQFEMPVYKFAYSLCHNHDDADDIVGQVFLRVYVNLSSFRYEAAFTAWLFRIVKNTYIDLCLRPKFIADVSLDVGTPSSVRASSSGQLVDPHVGPEKMCIDRETSEALSWAIKCLPVIQRDMMRMYYIDGKSYLEIAAIAGISIGTVKSRLNRARNMLRERLDPMKSVLMTA